MQLDSYEVIGISYIGIADRFRNPLGICSYLPLNPKLATERNLRWLAPPYAISKPYADKKITFEQFKDQYYQYLINDNFDLSRVINDLLVTWGPRPVFCEYFKEPVKGYRTVFAEAVMQKTSCKVIEVAEEYQLYEIQKSTIVDQNGIEF